MRILFLVFLVSALLFGTSCGVAGHYVMATNAMMPTLGVGDHLGGVSPTLQPIKRFDIVAYKPQPTKVNIGPVDPEVRYTHRVVGLPNEEIEMRNGKIYVNGNLLDESFEHFDDDRSFPATRIPDKEYFLLGDNLPHSLDSRFWTKPTIAEKDIVGVITKVIKKEDYDQGKRW